MNDSVTEYNMYFYVFFLRNRSQVQDSTFRVKDKEGIEDSKSSLQMFIFPGNCQFSFKFLEQSGLMKGLLTDDCRLMIEDQNLIPET